jgi:hypothetical protein
MTLMALMKNRVIGRSGDRRGGDRRSLAVSIYFLAEAGTEFEGKGISPVLARVESSFRSEAGHSGVNGGL